MPWRKSQLQGLSVEVELACSAWLVSDQCHAFDNDFLTANPEQICIPGEVEHSK
jgi:hypothetical protein